MSVDYFTSSESRFFAQQNVHDIPSDKMNQLSAEERSEGFYDLHGVSVPLVEETPDLVTDRLDDLDLEMFLVEDRAAYDLAMEINPTYVKSLRLRFLRAENFVASQAAKRMALHFDFRLNMFGKQVLGRDILLSDLPELERSLLEKGFMQVCSERDRVGRAMEIQMIRKLGKEPPAEAAARLFFFWMQYIGNQELSQKKGVVLIEYMVGIKIEQLLGTERRARNPLFLKVIASMPIRLAALHVCFDDPRIRTLFRLLTSVIEGKLLCRLQSHFGTDLECMYSMMAYGISPSALPVQADGSIDTTGHKRRLAQLAACESLPVTMKGGPALIAEDGSVGSSSQPTSSGPSPEDVLLGRGKHGKKWPGNLKLRKMVDEYNDSYQATGREGKIAISQTIYEQMIRSGTRFLVPCKSAKLETWAEMPRNEVCLRIAHMFRNLRAADRVG